MAGAPKLIAMDEDDLAVISAQVQDSILRLQDIIWLPREQRLVIALNRIDWEQEVCDLERPHRLVSALRFDRVLSCKSRNMDPASADTAIELYGIEFIPGKNPGGSAVLLFSKGGAMRLELECLECELADLGIAPQASGLRVEPSDPA